MSAQAPDPRPPLQDPQPAPDGPPPVPIEVHRRRRRLFTWAAGIVAVLIIAGAAASYLGFHTGPAGAGDDEAAEKDIPPTLRPYYDRAQEGDASAMRMLGTMYYNGLNVPQNTKEGIRWYRKAAAAGSVAAKKDLEQLGLAPEEP